jgi:hypothetical protein
MKIIQNNPLTTLKVFHSYLLETISHISVEVLDHLKLFPFQLHFFLWKKRKVRYREIY